MDKPPSICPNCHQPLPSACQFCVSCGYRLSDKRHTSWLWLAGGVLVLALASVAAFFLLRSPAPATDPTPTPTLTAAEQIAKEGGVELIFEADLANGEAAAAEIERAAEVMRERLTSAGVTANIIQVLDGKRIQVQMVGRTNPDELVSLLEETGLVEFVDTGKTFIEPGILVYTDLGGPPYVTPGPNDIVYHTVMTSTQVASASVLIDSLGNYQVNLQFDQTGTQIFTEFTRNHIDQYLTISYDRTCLSSPRIVSEIPGGQAVLQGNLTAEEATRIAAVLNSGILPMPIRLVESRVLDPASP